MLLICWWWWWIWFVASRRNEAAGWLRKMVGVVAAKDLPAEPSEEEFRLGLRSGIILCNVLNKVHPGAVPKVNIQYSILNTQNNLIFTLELELNFFKIESFAYCDSFFGCVLGGGKSMWFCSDPGRSGVVGISVLWECEEFFSGCAGNGNSYFWGIWSGTSMFFFFCIFVFFFHVEFNLCCFLS